MACPPGLTFLLNQRVRVCWADPQPRGLARSGCSHKTQKSAPPRAAAHGVLLPPAPCPAPSANPPVGSWAWHLLSVLNGAMLDAPAWVFKSLSLGGGHGAGPGPGSGAWGAGTTQHPRGPWQDSLLQVLLPVRPFCGGAPAALQPLLRHPDLWQDLQDQGLERLPQQGLQHPGGHG